MTNDIAQKITKYLAARSEIAKEDEVVYLLVECRKLLDHAKKAGAPDFPVLRFYCDWTVHVQKDRTSPEIMVVLEKIDQSTDPVELGKWIGMYYLKDELLAFLKSNSIDSSAAFQTWGQWYKFCGALARVLQDQPMTVSSPSVGIHQIEITRVDDGYMWGRIEYKPGDRLNRGSGSFEYRIRPKDP